MKLGKKLSARYRSDDMKTLGIVGCGDLAKIIASAVTSGIAADYRFVGATSRTIASAEEFARLVDDDDASSPCVVCGSIKELIELRPDYIIEAASPEGLTMLALPALRNGISIIALSIGALADDAFRKEVEIAAKENHAKLHIVAGAIGGFDVLRTASMMDDCHVSFATKKGPNSLRGTTVYADALQTEEAVVFRGNAHEAIALFPTKVNVAVAASLATVGPESIDVSVTCLPEYAGDEHCITLKSEQVTAEIKIYSKTAEIAGWSVVNTLRNLASPIVFG